MATWKKVPPELARRFEAALPQTSAVQRRQMFGCPCAFVNGNMFAGLHGDRLVVLLPGEAAKRPCVIMGRRLKQYALFADALVLTRGAMAAWIEQGYAYARTLPAKAAKPKRTAMEQTRKTKISRARRMR